MRDVGAGPAHVEADQLIMTQRLAGRDHPDHAACGAGEDCILPAKRADLGQPAVRLHEAQGAGLGQACLEPVGIAAQHGRQVGIDRGGIASRDQLDERRDLVADAHLREPKLSCELCQPFFVIAVVPSVHQHDGQSVVAFLA